MATYYMMCLCNVDTAQEALTASYPGWRETDNSNLDVRNDALEEAQGYRPKCTLKLNVELTYGVDTVACFTLPSKSF